MREESGRKYSWKGVEHYTRRTNQPNTNVQQAGWNDYSKIAASDAWWEFYGLPPDSVYYGGQGNSIAGSGDLGAMDYPVSGLPLLYEEDGLVRSILPTLSMKEYVDSSLRAIIPSIHGGFSAFNDAIELKDLKSIPHTIRSITDIANLLGVTFLPRSRWGRNPLVRLIRGASDVLLQFKFNIQPTLRDISKGLISMQSVDAQLKKLNKNANKPIVRHYKQTITDNLGEGTSVYEKSGNSNNFYYCGGARYERITSVGLSLFHATMDYSYQLPSMTPLEQRALALADYFGLQLNPAIIWNAIPWSFVVDWTLGVSQWLDQFAISNIRPVVLIRRYCASLRVQRNILVYLTPNWGSIHEGGAVLCSQVFEDAYRRVSNVPDLYNSITSSGLSPSEVVLAGALRGSRL